VPAAATAAGSTSEASKRDALETNTLAELYVKQGLPDRAIEVYRSMLRVEPGNAAARRRLAELESAGAAAPVQAAKPAAASAPAKSTDVPAKARSTAPPAVSKPTSSTTPDLAVTERPAVEHAAEPSPVPAATAASVAAAASAPVAAPPRNAAHPNRAAIERLERWLDGVKRGQKDLDDGAAA
jgi:pentatricopeptide repeat protein